MHLQVMVMAALVVASSAALQYRRLPDASHEAILEEPRGPDRREPGFPFRVRAEATAGRVDSAEAVRRPGSGRRRLLVPRRRPLLRPAVSAEQPQQPQQPPLPTHPPPAVTVRQDGVLVETAVHGARANPDEPLYEEPDYGPITPTSYGFVVHDPATKNNYNRAEQLDETGTTGSYRIALPDGRTQIVTYRVTKNSGFVAKVTYEGTALYPEDLAPKDTTISTRAPVTFFDQGNGAGRRREDRYPTQRR